MPTSKCDNCGHYHCVGCGAEMTSQEDADYENSLIRYSTPEDNDWPPLCSMCVMGSICSLMASMDDSKSQALLSAASHYAINNGRTH